MDCPDFGFVAGNFSEVIDDDNKYTLIKRRNYENKFYCAARAPGMLNNLTVDSYIEKMCFHF